MSTKPPEKFTLTDGNVGVESGVRRGARGGDLAAWVEVEGYKHRLFLTVDEANRIAELLDEALDRIDPIEDAG